MSAALVARVSYGVKPGPGVGAAEDAASGNADAVSSTELIDLSRPLDRDVALDILTEKDPDALFVFRHSAAHLLAAAVLELFPDVKLGIGPPIDTGFFYEFLREQPFNEEDLAAIEKRMHDIASRNVPNERTYLPKAEALELYKKSNQIFKCELIEEKATGADGFFLYHRKIHGFRRGPHIPSTGKIQRV